MWSSLSKSFWKPFVLFRITYFYLWTELLALQTPIPSIEIHNFKKEWMNSNNFRFDWQGFLLWIRFNNLLIHCFFFQLHYRPASSSRRDLDVAASCKGQIYYYTWEGSSSYPSYAQQDAQQDIDVIKIAGPQETIFHLRNSFPQIINLLRVQIKSDSESNFFSVHEKVLVSSSCGKWSDFRHKRVLLSRETRLSPDQKGSL